MSALQFCDDTTVEKQRAIKEANEMIEILEADIQKYEADAAQLAKEIAKHDEDVSTWDCRWKTLMVTAASDLYLTENDRR